MALTVNHPLLKETRVHVQTTSIGGTPVAAYVGMPIRGRISKIQATDQGAITTADCTMTVAVNGTTNTALGFTIPLTGAAAGRVTAATPTSAVYVSEDDYVTLTPSGASGASIGCIFVISVQAA
jgi:hypothetical protein